MVHNEPVVAEMAAQYDEGAEPVCVTVNKDEAAKDAANEADLEVNREEYPIGEEAEIAEEVVPAAARGVSDSAHGVNNKDRTFGEDKAECLDEVPALENQIELLQQEMHRLKETNDNR